MNKEELLLNVHNKQIVDNPMISPIYQTSSFIFKDFDEYIQVNNNQKQQYTYTRDGNPTLDELECLLASLENGKQAKVFASGMAAISGTILSLLQSNDHIILINTVYGSSVSFIKMLKKFNIEYTHILTTDTDEINKAIQENTRMIYFESPSSQKYEMLDLEAIAHIARKKKIYTMIDNTLSSPLFQNPLLYDIDIVVHSCSKYIGGHSDVVGGVVISDVEIVDIISSFAGVYLGATMSPNTAMLCMRGIRTMATRMKQQQITLTTILDKLQDNRYIEKIYHPYIQQCKNSKKYLSGYSSLFSIVLKDITEERIRIFVNSLEYFTLAYSWGGFESLILPVYKGNNQSELDSRGLSRGHFRVYLGLESADVLYNDIIQALDKAYQCTQ